MNPARVFGPPALPVEKLGETITGTTSLYGKTEHITAGRIPMMQIIGKEFLS